MVSSIFIIFGIIIYVLVYCIKEILGYTSYNRNQGNNIYPQSSAPKPMGILDRELEKIRKNKSDEDNKKQ